MKIGIISFNIRCCDDEGGYSIAERAPRLQEILSKYEHDVIGLQEVRAAWEPHIERIFLKDYDMLLKYRNETVDREASPILWKRDKFRCLDSGYFWLSDTPETESRGWDELYNCYRMCVWVILEDIKSGCSFAVMNTHFGFGDEGQQKSVALLAQKCREISDLPTIIVGDFNMKPDSVSYAAMCRNFTDVNAATAKDWGTTYHNYNPEAVTDEHIDYCFIDGNITPISQKIINDTVGGKFPSDHFGIYSVLDV